MQRRSLMRHGLAAALASSWGWAHAQARAGYPERPVTLVVPFPAGGASDNFSRVIGRKLQDKLGQPFIVDNRVGATGLIGTSAVQRAKPDGYTLLVASNSSHIIAPLLKARPPYDGASDFEPVTLLGSYPLALQVNPLVSARSARELIELAKKSPGKLNFGSIGEGSVTHFAGELFKQKAGIDIMHVPYKGSGALSTALIAGEIDMMFDSVGIARPFVEAGRVRALAVTGDKRSPLLTGVASLAEAGVPGVDVRVWIGAFAPKGTPKEITGMLQAEMARLLASDKDVQKAFADNGTETVGSTPQEFGEQLRKEKATWQQLVATLKLAKD